MVVESGGHSPQTELGQALRMAWWSYVHRIDTEMESAGHPERRFSMNYVFALYAQPGPMTISEMGRQFEVSRQAASKIVAELRDDGYVLTVPSSSDQREKVIELTPKAIEYVTARRDVAAELDAAIRARLGTAGFDKLRRALDSVGELSRETTEYDPANIYRSPRLW